MKPRNDTVFPFPAIPFYRGDGQVEQRVMLGQDDAGQVLLVVPLPGIPAGAHRFFPYCARHGVAWDPGLKGCPKCGSEQ
jgi:hypothetical protein